MKAILLLVFTVFLLKFTEARQMHSVINGTWGDTATWSNHMLPDSINDTIVINTHVYTTGNIIMSTNNVLVINGGDSLCGNDSLYMWSNGQIVVYGYIGMAYCETDIVGNGTGPDFYELGYNATVVFGSFWLNAGTLEDSLGCLFVWAATDYCLFKCPMDTNLSLSTTDSSVTFSFAMETVDAIYFGDGADSSLGFQTSITHVYADSGYYEAEVIRIYCCSIDTSYYTIHITHQAPPPCMLSPGCAAFPDPADAELTVFENFCSDREVTVSLYTDIGQLALSKTTQTSDGQLSLSVPTYQLTDGCYFIDLDAQDTRCIKKFIVIHP